MTLTDYYRMQKGLRGRSKSRYDCVASAGEYELFEDFARRAKDKSCHFYLVRPEYCKADVRRRPNLSIINDKPISGVFQPLIEEPLKGYGDIGGENWAKPTGPDDALLFNFNEDMTVLEVFVARGYRHMRENLFTRFVDGELDEEVEVLRKMATPRL